MELGNIASTFESEQYKEEIFYLIRSLFHSMSLIRGLFIYKKGVKLSKSYTHSTNNFIFLNENVVGVILLCINST